jgi:hypothetical protein
MNKRSKRTKSRYNKIRESRKKEEIEEIEVTVLKPEEVNSVQELERQNRKPTWAKKKVL